jgi:hypothetical protein
MGTITTPLPAVVKGARPSPANQSPARPPSAKIVADKDTIDLTGLDGGHLGSSFSSPLPMATGTIKGSTIPQRHETSMMGAPWLEPANGLSSHVGCDVSCVNGPWGEQ